MKKRHLYFAACILVVVVLVFSLIYFLKKDREKKIGKEIERIGKSHKEIVETYPEDEIFMLINGEEVSKRDYETYRITWNMDEDETIAKITTLYLMVQEAKERGFDATDEEVEKYQQDKFKESESDFLLYIDARGITLKEYLLSTKEGDKKTILMNKLLAEIEDEYEKTVEDKKALKIQEYFDKFIDELKEKSVISME